jgi:predicted Kef-type K+ transport protein
MLIVYDIAMIMVVAVGAIALVWVSLELGGYLSQLRGLVIKVRRLPSLKD